MLIGGEVDFSALGIFEYVHESWLVVAVLVFANYFRIVLREQYKKFAELIVEDAVNIMKQEWYDWNNYPKVEGETPRDVGLRVGAKSQTIRLIHMIQKHFGVEK